MEVVSTMLARMGSHIDRVTARAGSFVLLVAVAFTLLSPCGALANAQLSRAARAADEGRFDEAVRLLTGLIQGERLSREDLLLALERRVLVYYALHRQADLKRDLDLLLAIQPETDFGGAAPPDLAAKIAKRRRTLRKLEITAHAADLAGEVLVEARGNLTSDGFSLRTLVGVRSGGGPFRLSYDGEVHYRPPPDSDYVEYFAAVIGPGGAVLVRDGSEDAPKVHSLPVPLVVDVVKPPAIAVPIAESAAKIPGPVAESATRERETTQERETTPLVADTASHGRRRGIWWTLGGASAAAVVATIVVFVARGAAGSSAVVQQPSVEYP